MTHCLLYPLTLSLSLSSVEQELFEEIGDEELEETRTAYQDQTATLWAQGMATDTTLLQVLAVGRVKGFDYLMHLTDDYSRKRVQHLRTNGRNETLDEVKWVSKHKHFKQLKKIKVVVKADSTDKGTKMTCDKLATGYVCAVCTM